MEELKILIMDAGYVLEYAHEMNGRVAQYIRDRETGKVVATLVEPKGDKDE